MPYIPYYRIEFTNNLNEEVLILISKKDGDPDWIVQDYMAREVKITCNTQGEGIFAAIISRELTITFSLQENDLDYWDEFNDAEADTWKVVATINLQPVFHGFALPDEGAVPFMDKPIDATIKAVDGLGLLKQAPLTMIDGNDFTGEHLLIEYIAAALNKTGLELPIRIYDDVFHTSMLTRNDDFKWDWFGQAKMEYRTFLKDATTFADCYEVLKRILNRSHRIFYWNGQWVIFRLSLYQYVPFVLYYTIYDKDGLNPVGYQELENYATVGRTEIIRAINKDQVQSSAFAVRSAKTLFNYELWPELPKNNKFDRGTALNSGTAYDETDIDNDGDTTEVIGTFQNFTVDDWVYGLHQVSPSILLNPMPSFDLIPSGLAIPLIRRVTNPYGIEISRELILPQCTENGKEFWFRSEGIPVLEGDKISFGIDKRFENNIISGEDQFTRVGIIYIVPDSGGQGYALQAGASEGPDGMWQVLVHYLLGVGYLKMRFSSSDDDARKYHSVTVESQPIPCNGTMYIALIGTNIGGNQIFRNINFEYKPFVVGGFKPVSGDYWLRSQNKSFSDKSEEEVSISDNAHKIFKGCILDNNGLPTTPQWHRHGISESRHYKELVNIAEYNLLYRRFYKIEGTFRGTTFAPNNNQTNAQPLGFHKTYRFVDYAGENRQFVFACPFEMNLINGQVRSNYAEVLKAGIEYTESVETEQIFRGRIVNAINDVTESEWDSAGNAPSPQTGFPPIAYMYPDEGWITGQPRSVGIITNVDDSMSASGAGISEISNTIQGDHRLQIFQFANVPLISGNEYIFSIYGHDVSITVGTISTAEHDDGKLLGDSAEFKYQF